MNTTPNLNTLRTWNNFCAIWVTIAHNMAKASGLRLPRTNNYRWPCPTLSAPAYPLRPPTA